jgi:hypothetical protein
MSRIRIIFAIMTVLGWLPALAQPPEVRFVTREDRVDVEFGGKLFTSYRHKLDPTRPLAAPGILLTKPVLWPLVSPSGLEMTRSYPFARVPGESVDHPHHMGVFFAVDRAGGQQNGFWNNSQAPTPAIRHEQITLQRAGLGSGELDTRSIWVGKDGLPLLREDRRMVFRYLDEKTYAIDFTITLTPTAGEVSFEDTKEGMFAVRVAQWLTEKETGRYLNSEGQELEAGVWGKRADWVRLQGETDGRKAGIAILSHPSSLNSPSYWHARGYGCFSVNPLGQLDFEKALGAPEPKPFNLRLRPGEKALFKYRIVVYEGDFDQAKTQRLYDDYVKVTD